MKFRFPIVIIDEDFRSENTSGLGIRALADAIEGEGYEVMGVTSYGDLSQFAQQQSRASAFILSIDDEEFTPGPDLDPAVMNLRDFIEEVRRKNADVPIYVYGETKTSRHLPNDILRELHGFIHMFEDTPEFVARHIIREAKTYLEGVQPPFFKALLDYAEDGSYSWHCPGHSGGVAFLKSPVGQMYHQFYGENMLRADVCNAVEELGQLLDHNGAIGESERNAARIFNADHCFFVTNGTSTSNKMVWHHAVAPDDVVVVDRNCHKSVLHAIIMTGAVPVFVDILPDTYNLDPEHLILAVEETLKAGKLKPAAVIAVDLFGQPADYPKIAEICRQYGLKLLSDSAQGFGCALNGHHPLHWADATSTSFFPAKPLGCYGDGGAVLMKDQALWDVMDSLRVHGKGVDKYDNVRIGMNSRLDTLQAAILLEKLKIFADEIVLRNRIADRYAAGLAGHAVAPKVIAGGVSTWAQYTIEHPDRDGLAAHLKTKGVPTAAYYPRPVHRQSAYAAFPVAGGVLPVTDEKAGVVLALPMSPYLSEADQDVILDAIRGFNG